MLHKRTCRRRLIIDNKKVVIFLKKKNKIQIYAPLSKHGGREVETGFIASILENDTNTNKNNKNEQYKKDKSNIEKLLIDIIS